MLLCYVFQQVPCLTFTALVHAGATSELTGDHVVFWLQDWNKLLLRSTKLELLIKMRRLLDRRWECSFASKNSFFLGNHNIGLFVISNFAPPFTEVLVILIIKTSAR